MNKITLVSSSKKQIPVDNFHSLLLSHQPLSKEMSFFINIFLKPLDSLSPTCSTPEQSRCFLPQQSQPDKLQSEKAVLENGLITKYFRKSTWKPTWKFNSLLRK